MTILSVGELYVLAGLAGSAELFGVEDTVLKSWQTRLRQHIQDTMQRLEKRMLILCEPSGKVYWDETVLRMIRCLCKPDMAMLAAGNAASGRRSESRLFRSGEDIVQMRRIGQDACQLTLLQTMPEDILFGKLPEGTEKQMHICLPAGAVQQVRRQMDAFNREEALQEIQRYLPDAETAETALAAISGHIPYVQIRCLCRCAGYYRREWGCLLTGSGADLLRLTAEPETLVIDSVTRNAMLSECRTAFLSERMETDDRNSHG